MIESETAAIATRGPLSRRLTRLAIPILGLMGMGISGYLGFAYWLGEEPVCFGSGGCGHVMDSPYSSLWGVPLPLLGLAMYAVLTALGFLAVKQGDNTGPRVALSIYTVALAGTLYSASLAYLQFSVIQGLCIWCLGSALVVTSILLLSLRGLFSPPSRSNSRTLTGA